MESPPAKSSTKKHSLVILRHDLDAAAIHWTRTGFIFVHAGPNLCQLILGSVVPSNQRNTSGTIQETHTPKFSGWLHQHFIGKKICKMVGPEFLRFSDLSPFVPAMVWTKENYGRCPWWMYLLYTYTLLRIRKYLKKKIHSSNLHDFQVAKFYHHHFNFQRSNCVLRNGASPSNSLPFSQDSAGSSFKAAAISSGVLPGILLASLCKWMAPTWVTWPYTSSTTRLIPSASSPPRRSYRCENLANFVPSMAFLCSLEAALP